MRLIDADCLINSLKLYPHGSVIGAIEQAPTVDAVPVIRCNDCKHRIKWKESYGCAFWGYYGDEFADGEMFCSKGEKKDDE